MIVVMIAAVVKLEEVKIEAEAEVKIEKIIRSLTIKRAIKIETGITKIGTTAADRMGTTIKDAVTLEIEMILIDRIDIRVFLFFC